MNSSNNNSTFGKRPTDLNLHLAVKNNDQRLVRYLVDSGADISETDNEGNTPLHIAASRNNSTMIETLVATPGEDSLDVKDLEAMAAELDASFEALKGTLKRNFNISVTPRQNNNRAVIDSIRHTDGWTPLYTACFQGNLDSVKTLLKYHANARLKNKEGWTALHAACHQGYVTIVKALVDLGPKIDLNVVSNQGTTPLLHAVESGCTKIIKILVEAGADIEGGSTNGWKPLHMAVFKGYNDITTYLISKGAKVNEVVYNDELPGYTPLHIIVSTDSLSQESKDNLQLLLDKNADITIRDDRGGTPLHLAAFWGNADAVRLIAKSVPFYHAIFEVEDKNKETAAEVAAYYGKLNILRLLPKSKKTLVVRKNISQKVGTMVGPSAPPAPV